MRLGPLAPIDGDGDGDRGTHGVADERQERRLGQGLSSRARWTPDLLKVQPLNDSLIVAKETAGCIQAAFV
jgi:hypothetical protein